MEMFLFDTQTEQNIKGSTHVQQTDSTSPYYRTGNAITLNKYS